MDETIRIARPEPAPVPAGRPCAVPGCGAWADVAAGGLALCRDHAEAFAEAYGLLAPEASGGQTKRAIR
jgi:hypothetical protein